MICVKKSCLCHGCLFRQIYPIFEEEVSDKLYLMTKGYFLGCYEKLGFELVENRVQSPVKKKIWYPSDEAIF
ncbi:MAG TPA: hypothetical protein DHU93_09095 [Algoriphagus sp.]|jgi:hypothetical protein|nr:hypothetical protein [Algoriphagus sp.]